MCNKPPSPTPLARQRGLTFVELIFFIVIVSVGLAGILLVLNQTTSRSADPLIRKQMLAIAEGVMEEVRAQLFTWCDPDDANAATATRTSDCALGTPAETRGDAINPWDQVTDYNGATLTKSLSGTDFPTGYSAKVDVADDSLGGIPSTESLRITVTVTRASETLVLEGYRTRYAPNP